MIDFSIEIAGKVMRFKSDSPSIIYNASEANEFDNFLYEGTKDPDIVFDIKYGSVPVFDGKETLFSVDDSWTLSRYKGNMLFEYSDRSLEGRMERVAKINEAMTEGIIYVNREKTAQEEEESEKQRLSQMTEEEKQLSEDRKTKRAQRKAFRTAEKISYGATATLIKEKSGRDTPEKLGRTVMSQIRANFFVAFLVEYVIRQNLGFIIHCASVYSDNKLFLFMGRSGVGKSTIAEFWHDTAGATVFNDDRAIVNVKDGKPYFYNLPWAGSLTDKCELSSGNGTEIDSIYFIYQNDTNTLKKLSPVKAAPKIFRNSFPVFWERAALNYVLGLCAKVAVSIPCYDLGFVNNESVVDFLKRNHREHREVIILKK